MFVGIVIASLAVLSIVYFYAMDSGHSPESVRKKFETATGIDKSLVYNNYRLRGTSTILATNRSVRKPVINKDLYFEMIFNKPNKFYIDHYEAAKNEPYTSPRKSVVKEGSNGSSGWSYSNFDIAKPETTQTQNPGEVGHEIYLGLSDFVSARIIEDDICKQVDDVTLNMIQPPISYKVDGEQKMAGYCKTVKLQVLEVGEKDKSTLEFAADTGLLLSSFSSEDQNPLKGSTRLVYSEYKEFRIKKKSFWGAVTEKPILMPSKMIVTYESGEVTVRITIKIDSLETDVLIDTSTFEMPM